MFYLLFLLCLQTYAYNDWDDDSFYLNGNFTGYLGGQCNRSCNPSLSHVYCDHVTMRCECDTKYPVRIGPHIGCAKPVNLGEQCFYVQTCEYNDENSACIQVNHNAICQCKHGYHMVTLQRPTTRVFCSADSVMLSSELTSLLGVATGLAVFTALICFVLKLFVGSRPRHYANANVSHPLLFSSQPVSVLRGGFTGRSSQVLMPSSRAGAARAAAILLISCHLSPSHGGGPEYISGIKCSSTASVHSSSSSIRSFSARQFERERENRLAARARSRKQDGRSPSPRSSDNLLLDSTNTDSNLEDNEFIGLPSGEMNETKFADDSSSAESQQDVEIELTAAFDTISSDSNSETKEHNETCFTSTK